MIKAKKFRRRADDVDDDDDDWDTEESEKIIIKTNSDKLSKEKEKVKSKPAAKSVGPQLLSFAEDEEYGGGREAKSSSFSGKSVSKKDKSKGKPGFKPSGSLLSFGGEDDEKVGNGVSSQKTKKKSSGVGLGHGSSQRFGFGREKSLSGLSLQSNVQPQAGEYTKEKLAELQRNTVRLGGPNPPPVENTPTEPVVVLKGLVKPPAVVNANITDGVDRDFLGEANTLDAKERVDRLRDRDDRDRLRRDKDDAESRLELMGIGAGAESGGITHIPDAAAIAAAKAMRERARQAQSAPDYIALAPGDGADLRSKLRDSGLVRDHDDVIEGEEDDSSADEGEIQGRLAFMGDKITPPKTRTGVFETTEERSAEGRAVLEPRDEDEEDEERRWEEEQLRKGFGKRVEETPARVAAVPVGSSQVQGPGYPITVQLAVPSVGGAGWGFGRALEGLSIAQQAEAAMRSLQESAQRLRETHARTQSDLHRAQENLVTSVQNVSSLEKNLAAAGDRYIYMQELRDYISVLCDFLQDKAPVIEELEEHMQKLHEERANAVMERRAGDNTDELAEIEVAVEAAKAVLSKGGGTASATAAAVALAAAHAAKEGSNMAPQLDEFGRDVNLQKRLESKQRAQRRASRVGKKRAHALFSNNGDTQRVEGESSSDESESELSAYESRREEVLETAKSVFRDAADEFAQLTKVKEKLEGWKSQFFSAYRDAYVSLSAPAIFAPYVRLELLKWDPLYSDAGFSNMHWYQQLYEYGMPPNGKELDPNDKDGDLVPKIVEKVALPVLHHEIAHCWDRLSTEGTRNAVAAVTDILIYVPATSDSLQELLGAVRSRMAEAVAAMEIPTWSLHVMAAVPKAAPIVAQKFGTSLRLLRNIAMWKDLLALPVLEQLALDDLLSSKILPHLRTLLTTLHDAVTRTERVFTALSGVWVGANRELSSKLASFVEFVMALTRAVEKKKDAGASPEDTVGLARRVKKMLVELNEYDRARQLAKHFQLKEAL